MIYLQLFWEFFKAGLFAVGGGMATIPFLYDISDKTGWFTHTDLANMIAVGESTPGPIGVNMATYVGFVTGMQDAGLVTAILGAVTATVGISVVLSTLVNTEGFALNWKGIILAAVLWVVTNRVEKTKKWHPIVFIGLSALVGIVFQFG